jgi:putative oxidoreductase
MTRGVRVAIWVLSAVLAVFFAVQGFSKFWGVPAEQWRIRFLHWGYPSGFQYVVGAAELIAGLALLSSRSRKMAAGTLVMVMAGALATHLLHRELPRIIPPIILGACAMVLYLNPIRERLSAVKTVESKTQ